MELKSCAFTGHRPMRFAFGYDEDDAQCRKLKKLLAAQILAMVEQLGVTTFYTGMALGVDIWAAEIVLEMKKTDSRIQLAAVLPCETQGRTGLRSSANAIMKYWGKWMQKNL